MSRARLAVTVAFATSGAVFGTWTPRIPAVKAALGLDEAQLGLALFGPALGATCAMPLAGALTGRFGSRRVVPMALTAFCALSAAIATAPGLPSLVAVLVVWGAAMGTLDVAMNVAGLTVQRRYGRPVLAGFHGALSAGTTVGAGAGALAHMRRCQSPGIC